MNKKKAVIVAAVLICLTAVLAVIHLSTRHKVPEGSLEIQFEGKSIYADADGLEMVQVRGTTINGKGEEKEIDTTGVQISDVLKEAGIEPGNIESLSVCSDDEYSATLTGDEITAPDKAFLVREDDGSLRLIVFGDNDSKRNVKNVVRIEIR